MRKLLRNIAGCRRCGEIVESKSVHDFAMCKCGAVFTDGGLEYVRRGGDLTAIVDLSVYEPVQKSDE